jgi:hypothetical protein
VFFAGKHETRAAGAIRGCGWLEATGLRAAGAVLRYLRVDMLAAALITLMCLGENNASNSPLLTSLVIDMGKQTVAGDAPQPPLSCKTELHEAHFALP